MSEFKKQVILALIQNMEWLVKLDGMDAVAKVVGEPTPTTTEDFLRVSSMYVALSVERQAEMIIKYAGDI